MIYLQARGSILVASSPEILCRLGDDRTVTNRFAAARPAIIVLTQHSHVYIRLCAE